MRPRTHQASRRTGRAFQAAAALASLLVAGVGRAEAGDWKWSVTPYAWATDVGVSVSIDDRQVLDKTISVTDLVKQLDATAQVHVEAQHGAHGVMVDLFDVELSEDGSRVTLPGGSGAEAVLDTEIGMTILEIGGLYDPRGDQQGFSFLYGSRILDQRATIDGRFELSPTTEVSRRYETDDTLVDGLLGVRYTRRLSPRWSYQGRLDASAGGTDLTWSLSSSVSYAFGASGRYAVTAGYRRMEVDFQDDHGVDPTMTLSGFFTGLRISF